MAARRVAPLLVIVGETASGKSALALELAKELNGEIICADSWTVYESFDIGTAKPSREERLEVPHHLLDVADPARGFSAPQFQRLALAAIDDISSRGKLPIMVGGTGLYIDSVIFNYSFLPAGGAEERARLNNLSLKDLMDIATSRNLPLEAIDTRNKRRLIRLVESNGDMPSKSGLRSNTLLLGMSMPREQLTTQIKARVGKMIAAGLEQEVITLATRYGWDCEPMKGVGYREWREYFDGEQTLSETKQRIIKSTLDLAKKQRTWFRRPIYSSSIQWLDNRGKVDNIVATITSKLNK